MEKSALGNLPEKRPHPIMEVDLISLHNNRSSRSKVIFICARMISSFSKPVLFCTATGVQLPPLTGVASEFAMLWICVAWLYLGMLGSGTANFEASEFEVPRRYLQYS